MRESDLAAMQRAVMPPGGPQELLDWVARRVSGWAAMLDSTGRPAAQSPGFPDSILQEASGDVRRVVAGEWASASISGPGWWARAASGTGSGGPALLVTARAPAPVADPALVAHAAGLLYMRWASADRNAAVDRVREAVLQMLMAGQVDPARRVAAAMKPELARAVRVMIVEGAPGDRESVAAACDAACGGRAWIVRCPVYRRHVIILYPACEAAADLPEEVLKSLRRFCGRAAIGVGGAVALRDSAAGYEQAYHALALARHEPGRLAQFTAAGDLAHVLGPGAVAWARRALAPLARYEPERPQHPDGAELRATLLSWLAFGPGAARQLRIHRNTLADRVRRIEAVLDRDLSLLSAQAELHLALQLLHSPAPAGGGPSPGLDDLLAAPAARAWAEKTLAPLAEGGHRDRALLGTVRAWLGAGASTGAAARTLGVSARHVHRRLARAEQRLGRSLAGGPAGRHDIVLALRIADVAGQGN